jgi:hypothetical protein
LKASGFFDFGPSNLIFEIFGNADCMELFYFRFKPGQRVISRSVTSFIGFLIATPAGLLTAKNKSVNYESEKANPLYEIQQPDCAFILPRF